MNNSTVLAIWLRLYVPYINSRKVI